MTLLPHFKIETNGETFTDDKAVQIEVCLPENDVSYAVFTVSDPDNHLYISGALDNFNEISISFKRGVGAWKKVFGGYISNIRSVLGATGKTLVCSCWGWAKALDLMLCNTDYGSESANPSLTSIQDIAQDLVTNYVNEDFNSGTTSNWSLDNTKIADVLSSLSITSLTSPYLSTKELLNRLCVLGSAYAAANSTVAPHWIVDPDKKFYMKLLNENSDDGYWTRYWKITQAASTIEVAKHQILYDFQTNIENYANHIVLASNFRKPASDIWCEDNGPTWGESAVGSHSYSNTQYKVGSHSLKLNKAGGAYIYYPSTHDAAWNFNKCGSPNIVPHLSFYVYGDTTNYSDNLIYLANEHAAWGAGSVYWWCQYSDFITVQANKWFHISIPIGQYWGLDPAISGTAWEWGDQGGADWTAIDAIVFEVDTDGGTNVYIDDLHFSGKVIREAKDTSEITSTRKNRQYFMRLDSATDDTLLASDDSGTAAQLAYAELLRRAQKITVGKIAVPGDETLLPGHTVYVKACREKGGSYFKIQCDMRVKEVRHRISIDGFTTELNLTDDVSNALAFGVQDNYSLLKQYAMDLGHAEARDLKSSGVDSLIPRLSYSY